MPVLSTPAGSAICQLSVLWDSLGAMKCGTCNAEVDKALGRCHICGAGLPNHHQLVGVESGMEEQTDVSGSVEPPSGVEQPVPKVVSAFEPLPETKVLNREGAADTSPEPAYWLWIGDQAQPVSGVSQLRSLLSQGWLSEAAPVYDPSQGRWVEVKLLVGTWQGNELQGIGGAPPATSSTAELDSWEEAARRGKEAEEAAARADYAAALGIYEQLKKENPGYPLVRRRIRELKALIDRNMGPEPTMIGEGSSPHIDALLGGGGFHTPHRGPDPPPPQLQELIQEGIRQADPGPAGAGPELPPNLPPETGSPAGLSEAAGIQPPGGEEPFLLSPRESVPIQDPQQLRPSPGPATGGAKRPDTFELARGQWLPEQSVPAPGPGPLSHSVDVGLPVPFPAMLQLVHGRLEVCGSTAYLLDGQPPSLLRVEIHSGLVSAIVQLPEGSDSICLGNGVVAVTCTARDTVLLFDAGSLAMDRQLQTGPAPSAVAIVGDLLVTTCRGDNTLRAIRLSSSQEELVLETGATPAALVATGHGVLVVFEDGSAMSVAL